MVLKLRKLSLGEFKTIHEEYLKSDFPLLERKPFYLLARMYEEGKYACYVIEDGKKVGGYASFLWKNEDVLLLDYFAILSEERGSGLGSKMIKLLMKELKDKTIIFECESPETAKSTEDKLVRERRIDFYRKNGALNTNVEIQILGILYKVMLLTSKRETRNIKEDIKSIYTNMLPKIIFNRLVRII